MEFWSIKCGIRDPPHAFQKRRGIGNVITTLIILIASVVLGAGVIFFGGSLFQSNTGAESIKIYNTHIWVGTNGTGTDTVSGFVVQNVGDKVISIEKITIRGQSVPTLSWWYNNTASTATAANVQRDLVWEPNFNLNDGYDLDGISASQETLTRATGPISLGQGQAVFVFLDNPADIGSTDIGNNLTLQVQAGKASAAMTTAVTVPT